jgi:hypothetical protein
VAVKTVLPSFGDRWAHQFHANARLLNSLGGHPNIVETIGYHPDGLILCLGRCTSSSPSTLPFSISPILRIGKNDVKGAVREDEQSKPRPSSSGDQLVHFDGHLLRDAILAFKASCSPRYEFGKFLHYG